MSGYRHHPHPSFPKVSLPEQGASSPHYAAAYLEKLKPPQLPPAQNFEERLASFLVALISTLSHVVASLDFLWAFESRKLSWSACAKAPKTTYWRRRFLLLEGAAEYHGLGASYHHHLLAIWRNPDDPTVAGMAGEYLSHRTHLMTFLELGDPTAFTRVLLMATSVVALPIQFSFCLIRARFCHVLAQYTAHLASTLYSDILSEIDSRKYSDLTAFAKESAPTAPTMYYQLPEKATVRDALLCIRADDNFHAEYNALCAKHHCC